MAPAPSTMISMARVAYHALPPRRAVSVREQVARRGRLGFRERLEVLNLSKRGPRFLAPPHFFKDVGQDEILARLIRLPGNGATLDCARFIEALLRHSQERALVQCGHIMDIE